MKELVARVQAAARRGVRGVHEDRGEELVIEELRIDPRSVQAFVDGENAELTPTEFRLLYALALDRGRVASRDELLQRIWGRRATHRDRTVDVCVRRLREKIDQPRVEAHVHPDALRRRLQPRARFRSSYSRRYIGTRLFSASFSIRATTSTYGSRPEPCSFDFSSSSTW